VNNPDKKAIMLYLEEMYGVLKDMTPKFQASAEWNKKYDADEKQKKFAEWKLKKECEARGEIYSPPTRISSSRATSQRVAASVGDQKSQNSTGSKRLSATKRTITQETGIRGSLDSVPTTNPPSIDEVGLSYDISGRAKEGGTEGRMCIFTVTLLLDGKPVPNPTKEDLKVFVDCPGGPPKLNIMGGNGGSYHVGFTPTEGGEFYCDFLWRGHWCKEPFLIAVKNKANMVPSHPYTGPERKAAGQTIQSAPVRPIISPSTSDNKKLITKEPSVQHSICSGRTCEMTDEEYGTFNITAKDNNGEHLKGNFHFDVKIDGPSAVDTNTSNNGDGTYKCTFGPASAGEYTVEVTYQGQLLNHGTWEVNVSEAIGGIVFEDITILFRTIEAGKPKQTGGDLPNLKISATGEEKPEIYDLEDGRYTLDYHVIHGQNTIDVSCNGKSLGGFPLSWKI